MRYTLPDGYIDTSDTGNTYCGELAHKILHGTNKIQIKTKADFNYCLETMLKAVYERLNK